LESASARGQRLHLLVNALPDASFVPLRLVMKHLQNVVKRSHGNRMTLKEIAFVFGPLLMGCYQESDTGDDRLKDVAIHCRIFESVFERSLEIFEPNQGQ
jgi:hypothetical protein